MPEKLLTMLVTDTRPPRDFRGDMHAEVLSVNTAFEPIEFPAFGYVIRNFTNGLTSAEAAGANYLESLLRDVLLVLGQQP